MKFDVVKYETNLKQRTFNGISGQDLRYTGT